MKRSSFLMPTSNKSGMLKGGNRWFSSDMNLVADPIDWNAILLDPDGKIAGVENKGISSWSNGQRTLLIDNDGLHVDAGIGIAYPSTSSPTAGAEISALVPHGMIFPLNLSTSLYYAKTAPSSIRTVILRINSINFAEITIDIGSTTEFTAESDAITLDADDRLTIVFPIARDLLWTGVSFTFKGMRT